MDRGRLPCSTGGQGRGVTANARPTVPAHATPPLAYYAGDDEHGLDRAVAGWIERLTSGGEDGLERVRVRGDEVDVATLTERVATAPMFGGGTALVVVDSGPLVRSTALRDATIAVLDAVAPGNALAFLDAAETGSRRPAALDRLRDAIAARGGEVRELRSPTEGRMAAWIEAQATERRLRLGPGAAAELAARVGAAVREGDVDRRRMSGRAAAELEKLALYRPDGAIGRDDVVAVVGESVPASAWAFLDAVGDRKGRRGAELLEG